MSIVSFGFGIVLGLAVGIAIAIPATAFFFKGILKWCTIYAARYKAALDIVCKQYGKSVDCIDCQHSASCEVFPKYGENGETLCGDVIKRVIEDKVKKAVIK